MQPRVWRLSHESNPHRPLFRRTRRPHGPPGGSPASRGRPDLRSRPPAAALPAAAPSRNGKPAVLVVDDDPQGRDALAKFLAQEGYHAVGALRGDEGLKRARETHPIAVTLEILSGKDRWATLSALKADPALADIPVVLASLRQGAPWARRRGADYLMRPIDAGRLKGIVQNAPAGRPWSPRTTSWRGSDSGKA